MSVGGLAIDASTRNPIVLLLDPSKRRQVPIWIDHAQAHHIMAGIKEIKTNPPLSHDLMLSLLEIGELKLDKVIINAIEESSFQAILQIIQSSRKVMKGEKKRSSVLEIKARPSDAIALAIRSNSKIWMLEEVVSKASIPVDVEADEEDQNEFRRFLEDVSPASLISHFKDNDDSK